MIYLLFTLSLIANGVLVWYIRTLIKKYLFDVETIEKFKEMLGQYADSLSSLYRLEELYGDEHIKKAISQTKFVIEACEELKGSFIEGQEETTEGRDEPGPGNVIKLSEGEKVSQSASSYKRIVIEP